MAGTCRSPSWGGVTSVAGGEAAIYCEDRGNPAACVRPLGTTAGVLDGFRS